jgi:hypothetical protein
MGSTEIDDCPRVKLFLAWECPTCGGLNIYSEGEERQRACRCGTRVAVGARWVDDSRAALIAAAKAALEYVDGLDEDTPVDTQCTECVQGTVYYTRGTPRPELCWIHQLQAAIRKDGQ